MTLQSLEPAPAWTFLADAAALMRASLFQIRKKRIVPVEESAFCDLLAIAVGAHIAVYGLHPGEDLRRQVSREALDEGVFRDGASRLRTDAGMITQLQVETAAFERLLATLDTGTASKCIREKLLERSRRMRGPRAR